MKEKKRVPKLRFSEFSGEWEKIKLKDVSQYFNGGSFEGDVQENGKYELVTLKSIDNLGNLVSSKRYIDIEVETLPKESLVMILSEQAPGLLGMTAVIPTNNKYVLNQRVAEIRPNQKVDSYFLSLTINKSQRYFSKMGAGMKVQNISKPNVQNFEFFNPPLPEQQKIASFLSSVDKKIAQLQQKKRLLEDYKKGVMQQIFSQELRFTKEDGSAYPDWEEKRLGEVLKIGSGKDYKHLKEGLIPVYGTGGLMTFVNDYLFEGESVGIGRKGTIDKPVFLEGKFWTVDTLFYSHSFNKVLPKFIYYFFLLVNWKKYNEASGVPSLSKGTIEKINISVPCIEEQTQIAHFLSAIDTKIAVVQTQIEKTQTFKKGLLQQMFV
ncbi:MAG: restriction endonuclease subunit S [Muricauda sp.]|nr:MULTISPECIES: restriction endonuclease subunit S [unclassified Allomuricauda]MAU17155.1 restriction endonuclease subunit S [Allomuricauda sp.]|tara:strand:- start:5586 stop:6722 length:1137 start_codon:yes stop_codon:yes gene_type:complete